MRVGLEGDHLDLTSFDARALERGSLYVFLCRSSFHAALEDHVGARLADGHERGEYGDIR